MVGFEARLAAESRPQWREVCHCGCAQLRTARSVWSAAFLRRHAVMQLPFWCAAAATCRALTPSAPQPICTALSRLHHPEATHSRLQRGPGSAVTDRRGRISEEHGRRHLGGSPPRRSCKGRIPAQAGRRGAQSDRLLPRAAGRGAAGGGKGWGLGGAQAAAGCGSLPAGEGGADRSVTHPGRREQPSRNPALRTPDPSPNRVSSARPELYPRCCLPMLARSACPAGSRPQHSTRRPPCCRQPCMKPRTCCRCAWGQGAAEPRRAA